MSPTQTSSSGTGTVREAVAAPAGVDHVWVAKTREKHAREVAEGVCRAVVGAITLAVKELFFRNRRKLAEKKGVDELDGTAIDELAGESVQRHTGQIGREVKGILERAESGPLELAFGTYGRRYAEQVAAEEGLPVIEEAEEPDAEGVQTVILRASFDRRQKQ